MADRDLTRTISANDLHVVTSMFLNAAKELHVAMCLFDDDHRAQGHLNTAMHSILSGAEQCRQLHKSAKVKPAIQEPEEE